jgi:hypothetical protein
VRRLVAVLAAVALAAAGCGSGPTDQELVRSKVSELGRLTAAKDYNGLCDHVLAPTLIDKLKQIGLPCEVALQQGLGNVADPQLTIGRITVKDRSATAQVRTSAKGQQPSSDTLELVKLNDDWRVSSLGR